MIALFEKLYKGSREDMFQTLVSCLENQKLMLLVTANPEIFAKAEQDEKVQRILLDERTTITPDGEGIVKGAKMLDMPVTEKIAGVETVEYLLSVCSSQKRKVYFYGSKQETLDALKKQIDERYSGIVIAGMKNGYDNKEEDVFADMRKQDPDLILVALGVPRQERVIYQHLNEFSKGVFIGVGGSLDVLSGIKKRAPKIFIKCKLEWAYRLMKEPARIKKFCNTHITFVFHVRKLAKGRKGL